MGQASRAAPPEPLRAPHSAAASHPGSCLTIMFNNKIIGNQIVSAGKRCNKMSEREKKHKLQGQGAIPMSGEICIQ